MDYTVKAAFGYTGKIGELVFMLEHEISHRGQIRAMAGRLMAEHAF